MRAARVVGMVAQPCLSPSARGSACRYHLAMQGLRGLRGLGLLPATHGGRQGVLVRASLRPGPGWGWAMGWAGSASP